MELIKLNQTEQYDYRDAEGCHWNSPKEWLWGSVLGGCGCGSSEQIEDLAFEVLNHFSIPHELRTLDIYSDLKYEIIAHWMDHKELLEHGASVAGSWLSPKGQEVYDIMQKVEG